MRTSLRYTSLYISESQQEHHLDNLLCIGSTQKSDFFSNHENHLYITEHTFKIKHSEIFGKGLKINPYPSKWNTISQ